jgi:dTDP-glucose 4,6-dehydratase
MKISQGYKLLVTGGLGFIGSNFVRYMLNKYPGYQIVNLDKITYAGNPENLKDVEDNPRYRLVKGDIADEELVNRLFAEGVDAVINFAAETHVDRSISNPSPFVITDVYGTYVLLEAARKFSIKRFIQISTDEVYGEAEDAPCRETDALMPKSPYAASKAGADRLAYSYFTTYGIPVVITRCSNNFGPYQYPEKLVSLFITNALEDKPLPLYGDGQNRRDWIYVTDHCQALDAVLHAEGIAGEVFNIGAQQECTNLKIAQLILELLGKPQQLITFVADRLGHVRRHAVSVEKIRQRLGWQAGTPFEVGMEQTVRWYQQHQAWWRKIKTGEYLEYYRRHYGLD